MIAMSDALRRAKRAALTKQIDANRAACDAVEARMKHEDIVGVRRLVKERAKLDEVFFKKMKERTALGE